MNHTRNDASTPDNSKLSAISTTGCNSPGCCGSGPSAMTTLGATRRQVLKVAAAGALGAALSGSDAMAGPFDRADFSKLVPEDKKLTAQWIASLTARGEPTVYQGDELKYIGMPIGGIGTGQLYLGGDGKLWLWDIFGEHRGTGDGGYRNPPVPQSPVEQGFALQIKSGSDVVKHPLERGSFSQVTFQGQYPIATVTYSDAKIPVKVTLQAFSPFIPLNTDDSSLPATIFRFTLTNASKAPITASLSGWLQNATYAKDVADALRTNAIKQSEDLKYLSCGIEKPAPKQGTSEVREDVVFENWEKDSYAGWKVQGDAFGTKPARRSDAPTYMGNLGGEGDRLVNSHVSATGNDVGAKDNATGSLTSDPFKITRKYIVLWLGGGNHPGKTGIDLIVSGKAVRSLTGASVNLMRLQTIDVSQWEGQQASLRIYDEQQGDWGNIGVGKIVFSDRPSLGSAKLEDTIGYGSLVLAVRKPHMAIATADGGKGGCFTDGQKDHVAVSIGAPAPVGAIGDELALEPGKSATVDFILAWHFPNLEMEGLGKVGRWYASKFSDAAAVADYISRDFDRLTTRTVLWRDTWYDATLPHWLLDRTLLNISTLATNTAYRFKDGRFYCWEGVGCCPGTCTHVWHYAQATARLFPSLERTLRERTDLGIGFDERSGVMGFRAEFDRGLAVDGQSGTLLRMYREHLMSADDQFLKQNWPKIKKAFDPLLALDAGATGVLSGAQMNTLDMAWFGEISWLSSLYLAALRAGEAMAKVMGEDAFAQECRTRAERGSAKLTQDCFDGEYFLNHVDKAHLDAINSGTGCEIDQVFGQSWAFQVGLPRVLPEKQTRTALKSLWKYNFTPDVGPYRQAYPRGRWYAMPGEAGLLMCTFPRTDWDYAQARGSGADWAAGYFDECMNGFEHQVAGHMIWEGMVQEGLAVERAIHDRYHASKRNPWNEVECGDHYGRSLASYGVFIAACGYDYDGPRGALSFEPRVTPENFKAPFTAAEGWGTYAQQKTADGWTVSVDLRYGELQLAKLSVPTAGQRVAVTMDGKAVAAKLFKGGRPMVVLDERVQMKAGGSLQVRMS